MLLLNARMKYIIYLSQPKGSTETFFQAGSLHNPAPLKMLTNDGQRKAHIGDVDGSAIAIAISICTSISHFSWSRRTFYAKSDTTLH